MTRFPRSLRQAALAALSLLLAAASWAGAAPLRNARQPEKPGARVGSLVEGLRRLVALHWGKIGLGIDPDGASGSGTTAQAGAGCQGEIGAGIDPSGQCSDGR